MVERAYPPSDLILKRWTVRPAGRRKLVRVVVDADDGVGLDDIATLRPAGRRRVGRARRDTRRPVHLEVTSPGVDRPLTAPRHWRRARLRLVEAELTDDGKITGRSATPATRRSCC